jgi:hypothetical protein
VAERTLTIETGDGDTRTVARTTTQPIRNIRPMTLTRFGGHLILA